MAERSQMAVPKWSSEVVFSFLVFSIFLLGTVVAISNLLFQVEWMASCIWLALITLIVYGGLKDEKSGLEVLGFFARKQFVESILQENGSIEIGYGFQLFGYRFFYNKVPLDKIDTVKWSPGQAPRFWSVCVWYYPDDPAKSLQRQKWSPKPDQDVFCVGPSRLKNDTATFGLAFVDFLRRAGANLVPGADDCTFVQERSSSKKNETQPAI